MKNQAIVISIFSQFYVLLLKSFFPFSLFEKIAQNIFVFHRDWSPEVLLLAGSNLLYISTVGLGKSCLFKMAK